MAAAQYKGGWKPEPAGHSPAIDAWIAENRRLRSARLAPHADEINAHLKSQTYNSATGIPAAS